MSYREYDSIEKMHNEVEETYYPDKEKHFDDKHDPCECKEERRPHHDHDFFKKMLANIIRFKKEFTAKDIVEFNLHEPIKEVLCCNIDVLDTLVVPDCGHHGWIVVIRYQIKIQYIDCKGERNYLTKTIVFKKPILSLDEPEKEHEDKKRFDRFKIDCDHYDDEKKDCDCRKEPAPPKKKFNFRGLTPAVKVKKIKCIDAKEQCYHHKNILKLAILIDFLFFLTDQKVVDIIDQGPCY